ARVVVSTGAVHTLGPTQLAAVLAHERAHARGRHHLLADGARLLAAAFPHAGVFTAAHTQIDRLVEMRADDLAAACDDVQVLALTASSCGITIDRIGTVLRWAAQRLDAALVCAHQRLESP